MRLLRPRREPRLTYTFKSSRTKRLASDRTVNKCPEDIYLRLVLHVLGMRKRLLLTLTAVLVNIKDKKRACK